MKELQDYQISRILTNLRKELRAKGINYIDLFERAGHGHDYDHDVELEEKHYERNRQRFMRMAHKEFKRDEKFEIPSWMWYGQNIMRKRVKKRFKLFDFTKIAFILHDKIILHDLTIVNKKHCYYYFTRCSTGFFVDKKHLKNSYADIANRGETL